jgi:hypothetical protein
MTLRPATLREANAWIAEHHSHHRPVRGHLFSIAAELGDLIGVVVVGRPVAPGLQDGRTLEVTRLCTIGHPNAASCLLGAAWRAVRAMGVVRLVSYTRADEAGTSYRAAGWRAVAEVDGRPWTTGNKADRWLPGLYEPTTEIVDRVRWERAA